MLMLADSLFRSEKDSWDPGTTQQNVISFLSEFILLKWPPYGRLDQTVVARRSPVSASPPPTRKVFNHLLYYQSLSHAPAWR